MASASSPNEALMLGPDAVHSVNVHAVVLLSILDHHARRSERAGGATAGVPAHQDRALGVLLGSVNAGAVEVSNCFGVLHLQQESEVRDRRDRFGFTICPGDVFSARRLRLALRRASALLFTKHFFSLASRAPQVLIRRAAVSDLLALHRKVNDKETIVGWCVR